MMMIKNIELKLMPLAIKIILLFELLTPAFALLTMFNILPSTETVSAHERSIFLVSVMPCLIAVFMILKRSQRAPVAIVVSWFTVNLSSLMLGDNTQIEPYLRLIIGFVSLMGLGLFIYLKLSSSVKFYLRDNSP